MRYKSENFILDTDDYSLTRNGVNHPIEPRVFDLLVYLIENRNRVVTREELLEQLWNGRIVSDSAINARLKEARKAVGDTGKQQRVIKTLHRRGYQFIADVIVVSVDPQENILPRSEKASKSEKPSIAILRFNNLSNDPEQTYFSDGMATNICSRLSRIRSLQVKSGIKYDLANTTLADVALELEVRYVLSGSVQREADHVRVFVELTEGVSGDIRWSEHFDRRGKDVIDIQDDIAQEITGTLWSNRGTIREAERDNLAKKPTSDFNAFDYILKGISYKEQYKAETLPKAHECFDKAIELDPDSAEAFGWKAWVYLLEMWLDTSGDSDESLDKALSAAKKSIALDAYSEIGHWSLAEVYNDLGDTRRGFSEMEKALEINPNNPDLMVSKGTTLCVNGQFDEGLRLMQQGIKFNKHYPQWYFWHLGIGLFAGHQWQECIDALIRMDEQNKDTFTFLAACYVLTENLAKARACFAELTQLDPEINPDEIEKSHSYLADDSLKLMIGSIRHLMVDKRPQDRLRVVKT
ncbi:winged helix-turn-helix domain-containing tetratricopeptide repeat protein [Pseudomonadota bacterium]